MAATILVDRPDVRVFHASWSELLEALPRREDGTVCDLLLVDTPYSSRTHKGHDSGAASANRVKANGVRDTGRERRDINYAHWTAEDVDEFVDAWAPVTRGWIVSQTDDVLFPAWRAAMERHDRLTFQDVPALITGMTARLTGDGPSSWAIHQAVSRPRTSEFAAWGTLPGGYKGPAESAGAGRSTAVVGGKPLWLDAAIVRDYSRPGDIVCDPCCGGGTALEAALRNGRRAIGGDVLLEHAEKSARRVSKMVQRDLFARVEVQAAEQVALFAEADT